MSNTATTSPLSDIEAPVARQNQLPDEPTLSDVAEQTLDSIQQYAKRRPDVLALWCLGIGFVVGWKLKPW